VESREQKGQRGQTMAEYVVALGVISAAVVLALTLFGGAVADEVRRAGTTLVSLIP
jgi:Flp pilus assembly pilin Flp